MNIVKNGVADYVVSATLEEVFTMYGLVNWGVQCSEEEDFSNLYNESRAAVTEFVARIRATFSAVKLDEERQGGGIDVPRAVRRVHNVVVTAREIRLMCRLATMTLAWLDPEVFQTLTGSYREEAVEVAQALCRYADLAATDN